MRLFLPILLGFIFYIGTVRLASIREAPVQYLSNCAHCSLNLKSPQPCLTRIANCTRCMTHRSDKDPDVLEAGCCMSNCGPIYEVSMSNGRPTYFCQGDICNLKMGSGVIDRLRSP
ncbi:unnamed protein product [Rotaria magnacalcarata]|uniref:Uncharacterized protein n=1 Tax=Rotaria magnacalcarata TaxID=392030 RepID=A0A814YNR9_9BILA|nr:unnamed protein product [Rotaria magnacalcarata]CAF1400875.1 unnamed protein product [Rotaria magnacalcarata]CAF1918653.1 unnamed protein product [Rotaria magnacalcarata]CAF3883287.1 unnamed protein product [Rotaria magnacalcarata]CAF3883747.1 unnamed protein product [Rotaria magnacalcarata]